MFKPSDVVAFDGGFGVFSAENLAGNKVSFRSVAIKLGEGDKSMANFVDKSGYWLVGDDAVMQGRVGRGSTDTRYYSSDEFRVMTLFALQKLGVKNAAIMTGLPVESFSQLKQSHADNIKGFTKFLPKGSEFNIASVSVMPQVMGVLFCPDLVDYQGKPVDLSKDKVGILDMGDGTMDGGEAYDGKPNPQVKYGVNKGASDIHRDILREFSKSKKYQVGDDVTIHMIDKYLRDGHFYYQGEKVEMSSIKFVTEAKVRFLPEIELAIQTMWKTVNTLRYFIANGGTSALLGRDLLERVIPKKQLIIPQDPGNANVRGFLERQRQLLVAKKMIG